MPNVIETTVYQFNELNDRAKEKARDWFRNASAGDSFFSESTIEDAKEIGKILGIDIDNVYFSGFCSQGDGACFTGSYEYRKGWKKALKAYVGGDSLPKLLAIGETLQKAQAKNFYELTASATHRGRYSHSGCMAVDVERDSNNYQGMTDDAESDVTDELRCFADWIYSQLETEYEWINSDEVVDESIIANEYTFEIDGSRFG